MINAEMKILKLLKQFIKIKYTKMKTLQMDNATALNLYPTASKEFKAILEHSFGKEFFNQKITDRINSLEDLLAFKEITLNDIISDKDDEYDVACKVIKLGVEVFNEGWKADWSNSDQPKWVPVYEYKKGSGLVFNFAHFWFTTTRVGSRLCLKNADLVKHAVKILDKYYKIYFNN